MLDMLWSLFSIPPLFPIVGFTASEHTLPLGMGSERKQPLAALAARLWPGANTPVPGGCRVDRQSAPSYCQAALPRGAAYPVSVVLSRAHAEAARGSSVSLLLPRSGLVSVCSPGARG